MKAGRARGVILANGDEIQADIVSSSVDPRLTFIQFIDTPNADLDIPGKPFSFGTIIRAQAIGDFETLLAHKRSVVSFDLGAASIGALSKF